MVFGSGQEVLTGAGRDGHTLRSQRAREDFTRHRPRNGSETGSKRQHIEQQERDTSPSFCLVRRPVVVKHSNQDSNDEVRDEHERAANHEDIATSEAVEGPETGSYSDELRHVEHTRHDKLHVAIEAHGAEEGRRVVDEGVDSDLVCD